MSINVDAKRFRKFFHIGGVAEVAKCYLEENVTLTAIAERLGVSRECVRKDVESFIGLQRYREHKEIRRQKKLKVREPLILDVSRAIRHLSKCDLQRVYLSDEQRIGIVSTLKKSKSEGFPLTVVAAPSRKLEFFTAQGHKVAIRVARPGLRKENGMGIHRFKVGPSVLENYNYLIFTLINEKSNSYYIFQASEISHLRSLVLRYSFQERGGRYIIHLNNWCIMSGHSDLAQR